MISAQSIVDAAKLGITPFVPTKLGEGSIYEANLADESYHPVAMSLSGGLKIKAPEGTNYNAIFIQQVSGVVALGKLKADQVAYTDQLQGCLWEIWQDGKGTVYAAHAYKALNQAAKTIEGATKFKDWKLIRRFETAGKASAEEQGMVMAFSSVGSNSVDTVLIALDKGGKYRDTITMKKDTF